MGRRASVDQTAKNIRVWIEKDRRHRVARLGDVLPVHAVGVYAQAGEGRGQRTCATAPTASESRRRLSAGPHSAVFEVWSNGRIPRGGCRVPRSAIAQTVVDALGVGEFAQIVNRGTGATDWGYVRSPAVWK